jgi:hypothetical protein
LLRPTGAGINEFIATLLVGFNVEINALSNILPAIRHCQRKILRHFDQRDIAISTGLAGRSL